jgi:hypothetical protein
VIGPTALYNATTVASTGYYAHLPNGVFLYTRWRIFVVAWAVLTVVNFGERRKGEVRRIPLLETV